MFTRPVQNFSKSIFCWLNQSKISPVTLFWQDQSKISQNQNFVDKASPNFLQTIILLTRPVEKFHQLNQPKTHKINLILTRPVQNFNNKTSQKFTKSTLFDKSSPKFHQINILMTIFHYIILLIKSVEIFTKLTPQILDINGSN